MTALSKRVPIEWRKEVADLEQTHVDLALQVQQTLQWAGAEHRRVAAMKAVLEDCSIALSDSMFQDLKQTVDRVLASTTEAGGDAK